MSFFCFGFCLDRCHQGIKFPGDQDSTQVAIRRTKNLRQIRRIFLVKGAVLGLIMLIITYPISLFFGDQRIILPGLCYGLFLFLYALPKTDIAILRKNARFVTLAQTELIITLVQAGLTVLLALYGFTYWALVIPHFILPLLYWRILTTHARPFYPNDSNTMTLSFRTLMTSIGIVEFFKYWEERLDNLLAGKLYGENTLGLYNRAYMLISLPVALIQPLLENVLLPAISKEKLDTQSIWNEITRIHGFLFGLFFIPFTIFIYYPTELSVLLWGEAWGGVGNYLILLGPVLYWQLFIGSTRTIYLYFRKEKRYLKQVIINGIVLIGLMVIGATYSMERMILFYLAGLTWFAVPVTAYLGYVKLLQVPIKDIFLSYGGHFILLSYWQLALFIPSLPFQKENIIILGLLSGVKIIQYLRLLIR